MKFKVVDRYGKLNVLIFTLTFLAAVVPSLKDISKSIVAKIIIYIIFQYFLDVY